jgi:hypothetical protein
MQYPICRHIKTNGLQCQSPAISDTIYCYFHTHLVKRHQGFRYTDATRGYLIPGQHIELAPLEDLEAVQVAISVVVNAIATGQLEPARGNSILYGLQLAGNNTARLDTQPRARKIVLTVESSPQGLPLAEPGAVIDICDFYDDSEEDEDEDDAEEEEDDYNPNRT